ncbi:MAG TPA: hypothetical protein VEF34_19785 [Syntrophobacteraceae bacterium]|nr:hypothetical protein [Syntrophobacteraceae bacterium]
MRINFLAVGSIPDNMDISLIRVDAGLVTSVMSISEEQKSAMKNLMAHPANHRNLLGVHTDVIIDSILDL